MTLTAELLIALTLLNYFCLSRSLSRPQRCHFPPPGLTHHSQRSPRPRRHLFLCSFCTIKSAAARLCRERPQLSFPVNLLIHTTRTNVRAVQPLGVVDWIRRSRINCWFESLQRKPAWKNSDRAIKRTTLTSKQPLFSLKCASFEIQFHCMD